MNKGNSALMIGVLLTIAGSIGIWWVIQQVGS